MANAFLLGLAAQSSLLLSGLLVYWVTVPTIVSGLLAGLGAGALFSAIAFDLVPEADVLSAGSVALWALGGAAIFLIGDRLVEKKFGDEGAGGAMGIVVGSVVDGVPESVILGMQLAAGTPIGVGFVAAVLISNVPQAVAPSVDLRSAGWSIGRTGRLWAAVVASCGAAAAAGYGIGITFESDGSRMAALATGGLLAMLTNSLMPFAYERGREWAGVATVVGFFGALALPS